MRAVAYCRVSTNKEEQLDSLESQQKFFAEYAVKNSYELVGIYADEGKSGTKIRNRTQLLKLLSDAGTGNFEVVLIKDISRLARNTVDFLTSIRNLKALNIRVIFVNYDQTSSDSSEFMLTMLSAIAQEESANTSKRVRFGKKQNAEQGRVPNLIFGYDKTPGDYFHLNINKEEAAVVKRIFEMYTEKSMGAGRIASALNRDGIRTKRDCAWSQNAVCRILSNEIYMGRVINGKQEIEDFLTGKRKNRGKDSWLVKDNPALKIISEATFLKAEKIRKNRGSAFNRENSTGSYRFSQLLKCTCCGSTFRRLERTYKNTYITWVCNGRNSNGIRYCGNAAAIEESKLAESINEYFISVINRNPSVFRLVVKEYNRKLKLNDTGHIREKEYKARIVKLNRDKQKYMEMYTNEIIDMEELKEKTEVIYGEIKKYEKEIEIMNNMNRNCYDLYDGSDLYKYLESLFINLTVSGTILKKLLDRIEVDQDGNIDVYLGIYT